jgi:hypothetical protein
VVIAKLIEWATETSGREKRKRGDVGALKGREIS